MSIFLFLEINDPPVVKLLSELRTIFKERISVSPIHVTVRGPYKHIPSEKTLESFWNSIEGEGVLLNGIRHFEFGDKRFVYIQTHSAAIRKIWWKSDFPIFKYGFNPHITLYEGPTERAIQIENFLRKERLEFFCHELSLRLFKSGQPDLFASEMPTLEISNNSKNVTQRLIQPYRWETGIEERARNLMSLINNLN